MSFVHVFIPIRDMERTIRFYNGLLGIEIKERRAIENGGELAFLGKAGQPQIEFIYAPGRTEFSYEGFTLGFEVDDLDEMTRLLEQKGFPLKRGPVVPGPGVRFSFFEDEDGIEVQLLEHK